MAKTVKQKRLEGIIRRDVTEIIAFQVKDPDVSNVTVTDVRVSNDHSYATIYVTFYGNKSHRDAMAALDKAKGYIRSELAQRLDIRRCPELRFEIDRTEENGRHIDELIARIHEQENRTE